MARGGAILRVRHLDSVTFSQVSEVGQVDINGAAHARGSALGLSLSLFLCPSAGLGALLGRSVKPPDRPTGVVSQTGFPDKAIARSLARSAGRDGRGRVQATRGRRTANGTGAGEEEEEGISVLSANCYAEEREARRDGILILYPSLPFFPLPSPDVN